MIPSTIVHLGIASEIVTDYDVVWKFGKRDGFGMYCNVDGNKLYIFSPLSKIKVDRPNTAIVKKAVKIYEKWSRWSASENIIASIKNSINMKIVGRVVSVSYYSNKFNRNGKKIGYIHNFDNYPILRVDNNSRPSVIEITGGSIRITERGIIG